MLTRLSIRDVVLIEALDLEFAAGLAALTGETGAGKSILLDALGLALGARADSGLVRQGRAQALVTASFDLAPGHPALAILAHGGLEAEPGEPLTIRRAVKADGGSRGWINDQPASAALLREVGSTLVEIQGQHDDRGLLDARGHRDLLDAFGRLDSGLVARAHARWRAAEAAVANARTDQETAERDREWLEHAVTELTAFDPQADEEVALAEARSAMQRGARLSDQLAEVDGYLQGSGGALSNLRQAARRLDRMAPEHPLLAEALAAMDRAVIEASEAEDRLARAAQALSHEPDRLEEIELRLFELRALARKHRVLPDALADLRDELGDRLRRMDAGSDGMGALEAAAITAKADYVAAATTLGAARAKAAAGIDAAVAAELAPLKLDAARFRTAATPLPEDQWGPTGQDRIEFLISTNPGAPFAPLTRIASGGELSRFILALKVALAEQGVAGTLIFDEVDRGVGGAVASAIGDRLARLATRAQVLVVTHSPQVAARADCHFLIAKAHDGSESERVTRTSVHALEQAARREEIARMLSGAEVTDEARAQATRLIGADG